MRAHRLISPLPPDPVWRVSPSPLPPDPVAQRGSSPLPSQAQVPEPYEHSGGAEPAGRAQQPV